MSEHKEIECAMKSIPATGDEPGVSGHSYVEVERYESGCGVSVCKCEVCGHYSVSWWKSGSPPPRVASPEEAPERCGECAEPWPKHRHYCTGSRGAGGTTQGGETDEQRG